MPFLIKFFKSDSKLDYNLVKNILSGEYLLEIKDYFCL